MIKTFTLLILSFFIFITSHTQQSQQKIFYHEYNKTQLTSYSQQQLDGWIQQLTKLPVVSVSIRSYSDKKGTKDYNQRLSEQRSLYIMKNLQAQLSAGVAYIINHYGEDSLLSENDNDQGMNRRSIITITYKTEESQAVAVKEQPVIELVPYTEDVEEQHYNINLDDSVVITGKDGTQIRFAPGTMLTKKGDSANGTATLLLKEYYAPGDILLSGTHSESGNGLLQTGGMFRLLIVQNGDTLAGETKKPVSIRIPDKNNLSGNMNVFTMNHGDTSLWNDTRTQFSYVNGYWNWPESEGKLKEFYVDKNLPFRRWPTGRKWSEEYPVYGWLFGFLQKSSNRRLAKRIQYTLTKQDSQTLSVHLSETFRRHSAKQFYAKTFDTTFPVIYTQPYYETVFSNMQFVNCDRFINAPVRTDFYVRTPNFKPTTLLVYFKSLNAFMDVYYSKGKYRVQNVPPGEPVVLFAVGKQGEEFYCGKKEFTVTRNSSTELALQKVKHEDLKKMLYEIDHAK